MSACSVDVVGLGKRFWTGARAERTVFGRLRAAVTKTGGMTSRWAVREVSFSLVPGEALAVIGPNGAGKSTLLMLLAGLLEPTEGRRLVRGRLGSFLSPGAGLYPELSVAENIRLTAALYGMGSRELSARRDAIVAFGELEPYLDSRLGELSTGYQTRVVFSTALHADFDVLVFDEVLAVGDAAFAGRCLERMRQARGAGATVVLATHSLDSAERECDRALYLEAGRTAALGPAAEAVAAYRGRLAHA
jgi:ABC-type polysaccharide/polyol phosphate transport system ATPase subunit